MYTENGGFFIIKCNLFLPDRSVRLTFNLHMWFRNTLIHTEVVKHMLLLPFRMFSSGQVTFEVGHLLVPQSGRGYTAFFWPTPSELFQLKGCESCEITAVCRIQRQLSNRKSRLKKGIIFSLKYVPLL